MAMLGSFGELPFKCSSKKVLTFSGLSRSNKTRWGKHDVIGRKPVLELIGDDLSTGSLTIRFDISLGVPPAEGLSRLKRMMENHQYKTLIIGGENLGRYVIDSIDEERKFHAGNGICIVAEATVNFTEWAR